MYYIGIDVGGTNLVAGVVSEDNQIIATAKVKTADCTTPEEMIHNLVVISQAAVERAEIGLEEVAHVGVGIPGAVNRKTAFVYHTCNAPFHDTPFGELFRQEWDVPVYLENDANCAAMAEFLIGAARGADSALMVTLGTGVGGGYIRRGKLQAGVNLTGMEIGHMVIEVDGLPCTCGRRGCWEQYSSAPGLKRMTKEEILRSPDSVLAQQAAALGKVSGRTPFEAARAGCPAGKRVTDRYIHYLADGITNLVNIFQPEIIILGGGVSNEKDEEFLDPLRKLVEERRFTQAGRYQSKLVKARLGNDAGIIGASLLGRTMMIES